MKKLLSLLLIFFFLLSAFVKSPNASYAACNGHAIPINVDKISEGEIRITLQWPLVTDPYFRENILTLFLGYMDSSGAVTFPTNIPNPIASLDQLDPVENRNYTMRGFPSNGDYSVYIGDATNLDNPCNFASGNIVFTIGDNNACLIKDSPCDPVFANSSECSKKCPSGTICAYPGISIRQAYCLTNSPKTGEKCDPASTVAKCPNGNKCLPTDGDDKKTTCQSTPGNYKTPCGTKQDGSEGYDNGQCGTVFSGLGPLPTDPLDLIPKILEVILGVAGGIVVILIIRSGYKLMFSQGNPEKVQEAKDELTSAIVGLLFIIFSFVLLQFITNDLLKLEILKKGEGLKTP